MILIKDAIIIDENAERKEDLLIEDGKIKYIGKDKISDYIQGSKKEIKVIDSQGMYLLPSFVDMHFHLRNPGLDYKQTYKEANDASIKGGYTTVVAMANTIPVADCKEVIATVAENTKNMPLDVVQIASVTKKLEGTELVDFQELIKYTRIFSDDGKNVDNPEILKEALKKSKELGFVILDHDEPETQMVIRNLELVRQTGGNLHFCHISKKESMEAIIKAKEEGLNITVEVAPHHLFSCDLEYRVNPPIASKEDVEFLIQSIKKGYVDVIGTDHAPHSEEDKANGAPGIINIETSYAMVRKVFKENDISMKVLARLMSNMPSRMLGRNSNILEGNEANLVIISDENWNIDKNRFVTRSKNTPYDGWNVVGKVKYTIAKGEIIYDNARA
ncbi:MAG: dihydroorotase [Proteocatella sp.]